MIKVVDSIMGSGKTTYAFKMINQNPNKRYIFISPLLSEVDRIKKECHGFKEPEEYLENGEKCAKLDSLHKLLKDGCNIASTHALFKLTTEETIKYLKKWNYTLIIDEVLQVVDVSSIKAKDISWAKKLNLVEIDKTTGYIKWLNDKEDGGDAFRNLRIMCKTNSVFMIESNKTKNVLIWIFPSIIFNFFADIWVFTYLFDCQPLRFYFDMNGFPFTKYRISKGELMPHNGFVDNTSKYRDLIHIYDGKKNDIGTIRKKGRGDSYYYLSATWYTKKATDDDFDNLRKNIYGYFFNDLNRSPSDNNMWTCIKGDSDKNGKGKYQKILEDKGYIKGFLACNARATNDYITKTALAYPINVFLNPVIKEFFAMHKIEINQSQEDEYALSEMLQWIWRSAIRENNPINIYIPSCRMRALLNKYKGNGK